MVLIQTHTHKRQRKTTKDQCFSSSTYFLKRLAQSTLQSSRCLTSSFPYGISIDTHSHYMHIDFMWPTHSSSFAQFIFFVSLVVVVHSFFASQISLLLRLCVVIRKAEWNLFFVLLLLLLFAGVTRLTMSYRVHMYEDNVIVWVYFPQIQTCWLCLAMAQIHIYGWEREKIRAGTQHHTYTSDKDHRYM